MNKRTVSATALTARIHALSRKHQDIHALIEAEQMRPRPDTNLVSRLKRERLSLKDSLYAAQRLQTHSTSLSGLSAT
ncbi:YdcH family protein [Coralliovum pocilloporae]|uniref:YdcH family protein n=1 Tax=Coralliovum pocilloporae TaxID=3066369 RepID=UPI0033076648